MQETPTELANRLKVKFKDLLLLTRAVTHRSYLNEHQEAIEDNERLEFLGDAVLDFIVGGWLYNHFPEMPEGDLTQMRSALVQTSQLAEFAQKVGLGSALRLGRGELKSGGRLRKSLLCDAFEAFIGAIYIDSGIKNVQKFLVPLLEKASKEILADHKNEDPKSLLQEWAQSLGFSPPKYILLDSIGPEHSKSFEVQVRVNNNVFGYGKGKSKQQAEKVAALQAMKKAGIEY